MKRSEMLSRLIAVINDSSGFDDESSLSDSKAIAEDILEEIEYAGMLPPILNEYENCHIDISCHNGSQVEDFYQWEKEAP